MAHRPRLDGVHELPPGVDVEHSIELGNMGLQRHTIAAMGAQPPDEPRCNALASYDCANRVGSVCCPAEGDSVAQGQAFHGDM